MIVKPSLVQRIAIAFTLTTIVVAGAFALGSMSAIHVLEEMLLSGQMNRDLEHLIKTEKTEIWRSQPRSDQLFYVSPGPAHLAMPTDLQILPVGFHEVYREHRSFHAVVRLLEQRRYVLLQDQSDFERRERLMYWITLACFLVSVLLATILGWWLARRVIAPVVRLSYQVSDLEQLSPQAPALAADYAEDEVGVLAAAFDETLNRLRQSLRREQLFTSDVSHELRTPLMVMAGACELLFENPYLDKRARRQVARIAKASSEMSALVETFLQLARQQSAHAITPVAQASVYQIASELVLQWREAIESKGLTLLLSQPMEQTSAPLYNAVFLRAVMGNLLRNAWHYTEQGRISVHLQADGFCITDTGAGIPEGQEGAMFEPFIRGSYERGDGLGLGLSLVQRICTQEGWQIRLQSVQPHGCCFWVQLTAGN